MTHYFRVQGKENIYNMAKEAMSKKEYKNPGGIRKRMDENSRPRNWNIQCEFPANLLLEPTNLCNHACLMCANSKGAKKGGMIDRELAKRILKEAYELGTREVGFYGMGEPLLNKNLEEYIAYAKQLGYEYTYITTNGALLSEERARRLLEAGIDSVKFSINAASPDLYYLIHGKDEFDTVIRNLIEFDSLRKRQERNTALYISYIATRYTASDKEKFKRNYQGYADDIVFLDCRSSGDMADELDAYLSTGADTDGLFKSGICPMIFNKLHVTYDGCLSMCCDDSQNYLAVADLKEESLEEAWNNAYARDLRKRHLEHNLKGTRRFNCMNHCNGPIEPLNPKLAVYIDSKRWNKEQEIRTRIDKWEQYKRRQETAGLER